MKFDMNAAWRDAMAMISANKDVLIVVAGLFFFLPSVAVTLLAPELQQMPSDLEGEEALNAMVAAIEGVWPIILVSTIISALGVLTLLALLRDSGRPTVGEAIAIGAKALIPYFAAQLLVGLAAGILFVFVIAIGTATGSVALGVLLGLVAFVALIYVMVKVSLISPVIAIERLYNPIQAVRKSWTLTKGNSLSLLGFYALIFLALLIVSIIVSLVSGLFGAILGTGTAGLLVMGVISGLFTAAYTTVLNAALAAVHRQLSGPSQGAVAETFE